jgi:hypothetical protein
VERGTVVPGFGHPSIGFALCMLVPKGALVGDRPVNEPNEQAYVGLLRPYRINSQALDPINEKEE